MLGGFELYPRWVPLFERIISKLENNRQVNLEFSLLVKNKLNNNQEKHKLEKVLVVV